jgi:NADP-dependent 3-hydroxy acid dehydrogenase YdfG
MKKAIVVTGATSGIGLECVRQFLTIDNLYIFALGRNIDSLKPLECDRLIIKQIDVLNANEINLLIKDISTKYVIDGLINGAGVAYSGDFLDVDHEKNEQMIKVNTIGLTNMVEAILPIMRANKKGTILNLSSLADRYPRPSTTVYAATKAYVKSISDSLRVQNAKFNIRVVNISPALVDTPMLTKLRGDIDTINVSDFVNIVKFIYMQPDNICVRDIVVAPTYYEG